MKISDLLGKVIHMGTSENIDPNATTFVGEIENRPNVEHIESESSDLSDTKTMVAPLQQKLELLKKAVDVESYYDSDNPSTEIKNLQPINITLQIPKGQSDTNINLTLNGDNLDELDRIKKIAGIPIATIFDAGDDEPLDS